MPSMYVLYIVLYCIARELKDYMVVCVCVCWLGITIKMSEPAQF